MGMGTSTRFRERVYAAVKRIPPGKVCTYKTIAQMLGCKAYRAVGGALRANKHPMIIPCHRVVCSDGRVGGYCGRKASAKKVKLLKGEGITITKGKVLGFGGVLWR